jgi:organic hydroperoxide reductase OsmC/OhrA
LAWLLQSPQVVKPYPHQYQVELRAGAEGPVVLASGSLPELETAPPEQFDGPGDRWSPESLLVGAVADCFALTFRAVARASGLSWSHLRASATGTLQQTEGGTRFTAIEIDAVLTVPPGIDAARVKRLLEKAERGCLVSRSLAFPTSLRARIETDGAD